MAIPLPTIDQLRAAGAQCGLSLSDDELVSYRGIMQPVIDGYNMLAAMPDEVPAVHYPRTPGYRPNQTEDPHNAWYRKTSILGAPEGKLKGKRIALKDNIMLAGVPMMNGTTALEGYTPDFDATVVTRVLDAGAEIVGKAHCEALCLSANSYTNATGPIHNPHRMGLSAGGSSSGCGVVVALGEADMALGGDQGGSIRIPAALSGICGMKPSWGLVPYTGILSMEMTLDHTGPMTANVTDNARLLEVIAGDDGYDPRIKSPTVGDYTGSLADDVKGLKIALVREGFQLPNAEDSVIRLVQSAADRLRSLGAIVNEVSIPEHLTARAIFMPMVIDGATQVMSHGDGFGIGRADLYPVSFMDFIRDWRRHADSFPATAKLFLLTGTYITDRYGFRHYGKAMNIARRLRAAYDAVLAEADLLLMPTTPKTAKPFPGPAASIEERIATSSDTGGNTQQFNMTHHPAMSIPCGMADGLPVGMMLVGRHFEETTIYRAAYAFEQSGDWKTQHES